MSHFHNITPRQLIRGVLILGVILIALFIVTSNLGLVAAGGVAFIAVHLILASGIVLWGGSRLVSFVRQLHEPQN